MSPEASGAIRSTHGGHCSPVTGALGVVVESRENVSEVMSNTELGLSSSMKQIM